jgi:hypothetical protein
MKKSTLVARLKKLKKETDISYEVLSEGLGYKSPMTSYVWINKKAIPKKQYGFLDNFLKGHGY